jgi:tripartite ATP-independent transporter DctP family solute receptor
MKRPILKINLCMIILSLCCSVSCRQHREIEVLKLAHVLDTSHPVHRGMAFLAERLDSLSAGKLRMDIYPGGQLGSEREYVESLQIGSLDMTKVNSAVLENFVPDFAVFSLPYLFRDEDHRWQVLKGPIGRDLLLAGERVWLRGLCFYETGSRSFYLRDTPVKHPKDLQGLKIRVMRSYWSIQTINALGASATPIAFGELYTALQQGVVDGAENNVPTFYQSRHFEACKYYCLDQHSSPSDILLISTHSWNRLTGQQKQWLQQATDASVEYQRGLWAQAVKLALDDMTDQGLQVIYPEKEPFRAQVQPLYELLRERDDPLYDIVEKIRAVGSSDSTAHQP